MYYIIMDTETTGLYNNDEVIQLSAIKIDEKFNLLDMCSFYCTPKKRIDSRASKVHGITQSNIVLLSEGKNIVEQLQDTFLVNERNATFVFYNAKFDVGKILTSCAKHGKPNILPLNNEITSLDGNPSGINYFCLMKYFANKYYNKSYKKLVDVYDTFVPIKRESLGLIIDKVMKIKGGDSIGYNEEKRPHDALYDTMMTLYLLKEVVLNNR